MRIKTVKTKDLRKFIDAIEALLDRPQGMEGMGLVWGPPGTGKSTALALVANLYNGVYARALGCWSVTSMLGELCVDLAGKRTTRKADMVTYIVGQLTQDNLRPRPIFIDEADYCFRQFDMVDSLRDIYDLSGCPVILVGMENIARDIREHDRIARRITQWVEFSGLDIEDAIQVTEELCEVEVEQDLIDYLYGQTNGNIGRMVIGLTKIENFAQVNGMERINAEQWGGRSLYFDQPTFRKRVTPKGPNGNNGKKKEKERS
ncbi:MAG: AAA family ATPase [Spirochaetes bacterium GWB1_59_5]|nr:MAG: AAA family ATPase [Spirochaetes bacterium GWB1_59_5]